MTSKGYANGKAPDDICCEKIGSSRKVRETNREEPNEHKEETVISVAISKALGNFNLVIESLKFTC